MLKEEPPVNLESKHTCTVVNTHIHNLFNTHNLLIMSGPGIEPLTFKDISHLVAP